MASVPLGFTQVIEGMRSPQLVVTDSHGKEVGYLAWRVPVEFVGTWMDAS